MIKKLALAALAAGMLAGPALAAEKLTVETSKGCSFDITLRAGSGAEARQRRSPSSRRRASTTASSFIA